MRNGGTADSPVPHAAQEARLGGLLRKARLARRRRGVGGVAFLVHEAAVFGCGGLGRGGVSVDGHGYGSVRRWEWALGVSVVMGGKGRETEGFWRKGKGLMGEKGGVEGPLGVRKDHWCKMMRERG